MSDTKLSDEEIAEKLAAFMGWTRSGPYWAEASGALVFRNSAGLLLPGDELWNPANNIAQAFMVQAEIERRSLLEKWGEELVKSHRCLALSVAYCGDEKPFRVWLSDAGKIANATPRQRCLAAIAALPAGKEGE